jgi:hypothetical protein
MKYQQIKQLRAMQGTSTSDNVETTGTKYSMMG